MKAYGGYVQNGHTGRDGGLRGELSDEDCALVRSGRNTAEGGGPPQQAKTGLPPPDAKIARPGDPGLAGDPGGATRAWPTQRACGSTRQSLPIHAKGARGRGPSGMTWNEVGYPGRGWGRASPASPESRVIAGIGNPKRRRSREIGESKTTTEGRHGEQPKSGNKRRNLPLIQVDVTEAKMSRPGGRE